MIKHFPPKHLLLVIFTISFIVPSAFSQCPFTFVTYGSTGAAPSPGNSVVIETCNFVGEYETINGVVAGDQYTVNYSGGTGSYIVIYTIHSPLYFGDLVHWRSRQLILEHTTQYLTLMLFVIQTSHFHVTPVYGRMLHRSLHHQTISHVLRLH